VYLFLLSKHALSSYIFRIGGSILATTSMSMEDGSEASHMLLSSRRASNSGNILLVSKSMLETDLETHFKYRRSLAIEPTI
jgi:hypothetical protein